MPTTWGADWDYFGAADRRRHTLYPCPCRLEEASIVTELNICTNIKISNGKKLQLKILVDSGYIHMEIDKQLVKKEQIKTKPIDRSFKIFTADGNKNREVTRFTPL